MSGIPLEAIIIVDTNVLVNLSEYFCDENKHLPFADMVAKTSADITETMNTLRKFAIQGKIYTTPLVHTEFKPENSGISGYLGFDKAECEKLKQHVLGEIEVLEINEKPIQRLREMDKAPKKFGKNLNRISDPDLSLAILALGLAKQLKVRIYVLTDEEDLRGFISWMRTKPEAKSICQHSHLIESLHSLTYMDGIHKECSFTTEFILQRHNHLLVKQLCREVIKGTTKGVMITETMKQIRGLIQQSKVIKHSQNGGIVA